MKSVFPKAFLEWDFELLLLVVRSENVVWITKVRDLELQWFLVLFFAFFVFRKISCLEFLIQSISVVFFKYGKSNTQFHGDRQIVVVF
jgi:hypothetical protein